MADPSVTITIAGNDVSTDLVSLSTEQDICSLAQTCEIELKATSGAHAYDPWDTLVIAINGTNRLTGYVEEAIKSRGNYVVRGMDEMKRAIDTFITDEVRVTEELDAGYWINYWLTRVGIATSGSVETGRNIPPTLPDEEGWIYISVGNIILECLGYAGGGYTVIIDGDGIAQVKEKTIGASLHTLDCIEFSRSQDNSWLRDRAVVFGTTSGSWDEGVWIPGEVTIVAEAPDTPPTYPNTAVLSSSYIQSQATAEDLADDILDFFDEYLDVKRCLIKGDESIWLGDSASVSEFGYSGTGIVTSIETTVDDGGFRQLVSLDEKCGFVWGWSAAPRCTEEDTIHISYFGSDANLKHASMPTSGSSWTIETVDADKGNLASQQRTAIDSNGCMRIAYIADTGGGERELRHAYNSADGWTIEVIDSGSLGLRDPSIAIDSNGYSHISYRTFVDGYLRYAYEDSGGWNTEIANATNDNESTSLALDSNDAPHIACREDDNNDLRYVEKTSGSWTTETVDSGGDVGRQPSIVIDSNDYPHISYKDQTNRDLRYAERTTGSWVTELVHSAAVHVGTYSSIAIASDGFPRIGYYHLRSLGPPRTALRYAYKDDSGWHNELVVYDGYSGNTVSMALDSDDVAHISHAHTVWPGSLKYSTGTSGSWTTETVDAPGQLWTDIAIG